MIEGAPKNIKEMNKKLSPCSRCGSHHVVFLCGYDPPRFEIICSRCGAKTRTYPFSDWFVDFAYYIWSNYYDGMAREDWRKKLQKYHEKYGRPITLKWYEVSPESLPKMDEDVLIARKNGGWWSFSVAFLTDFDTDGTLCFQNTDNGISYLLEECQYWMPIPKPWLDELKIEWFDS